MENIKQIKKAEEEAEKIIETAKRKTELRVAAARQKLADVNKTAAQATRPRTKIMAEETDEAIKEYEKIAEREQEIALEKLEEIDDERINEAAELVLKKIIYTPSLY